MSQTEELTNSQKEQRKEKRGEIGGKKPRNEGKSDNEEIIVEYMKKVMRRNVKRRPGIKTKQQTNKMVTTMGKP